MRRKTKMHEKLAVIGVVGAFLIGASAIGAVAVGVFVNLGVNVSVGIEVIAALSVPDAKAASVSSIFIISPSSVLVEHENIPNNKIIRAIRKLLTEFFPPLAMFSC